MNYEYGHESIFSYIYEMELMVNIHVLENGSFLRKDAVNAGGTLMFYNQDHVKGYSDTNLPLEFEKQNREYVFDFGGSLICLKFNKSIFIDSLDMRNSSAFYNYSIERQCNLFSNKGSYSNTYFSITNYHYNQALFCK